MTNNMYINDIENPELKLDDTGSNRSEDTTTTTTHDSDAAAAGQRVVKATPTVSRMKREDTGDTENSEQHEEDQSDNNKLSGSTNTNNNKKKIPTVRALIYDFNGSIAFCIGSSGFILSLYCPQNDNNWWWPCFRYGCLAWIWGCLAYAIPILATPVHVETGQKFSCSDVGVLFGMSLFITGCTMGGFLSEERVLEYLVTINYLYVFGSFALAMEPLCQAGYFLWRCVTTCSAPRWSETILLGSATTNLDGQLSLNWDRVWELLAMSSFCVAGIFGGFGPTTEDIAVGVYFWEVGSIFCLFRSLRMWRTRRVGLRRLLADTTDAAKQAPQEMVEAVSS
jgi:hypothetical protein